jgi:hypothetical protein
MKIVVYACVPDIDQPIFVRRARVTMVVLVDKLSDELSSITTIEYLHGSVAHDTCHHEQSLDQSGQLTLDFLAHTMLLDDGPQEVELNPPSGCVINGKL